MKKENMDKSFNISVLKHDKKIHRVYNSCALIKEDDDILIFNLKDVFVKQSNKKDYHINEDVYWFLPKNKWYNIIWFVNSNKLKFYVNIASPIEFIGDKYECIDYDLDLKVFSDYSYSIIDMKDFNKNRIIYSYPAKVIESIWDSIDEIKKIIKNREFIFDEKYQNKFIEEVNNG